MTYLITGAAGFIGSNLIEYLIQNTNSQVIGIDNFDEFYDRKIKENNLQNIKRHPNFKFHEIDIRSLTSELVPENIDAIIHLAAKAGVRPSISHPQLYTQTNVLGTQNLLEIAKEKKIPKFIFASSSSVYGINKNVPWKEDENLLKPISPYAATKIAGELLGHVYFKLFGIEFIALRFFTVYGRKQRPDLVIHKLFRAAYFNEKFSIYGNGETKRDYTHIDDIILGIVNAIKAKDIGYEIINLGNSSTISLNNLIELVEAITHRNIMRINIKDQPGDVPLTYADTTKAKNLINFIPQVPIEMGLQEFNNWFLNTIYK